MLHAGTVLSAEEILNKYPNDVITAMKEYAKQFIVVCNQKSRVVTGTTNNKTAIDEQFLVTKDFLFEHENEWVFVDPQSILDVEKYIK